MKSTLEKSLEKAEPESPEKDIDYYLRYYLYSSGWLDVVLGELNNKRNGGLGLDSLRESIYLRPYIIGMILLMANDGYASAIAKQLKLDPALIYRVTVDVAEITAAIINEKQNQTTAKKLYDQIRNSF